MTTNSQNSTLKSWKAAVIAGLAVALIGTLGSPGFWTTKVGVAAATATPLVIEIYTDDGRR